MNQRTTELYQQALEFAYNKVPKENWNADILHPIVSGKFAELIVQECNDLLTDSSEYNQLPIAVDDMINIINTNFGIDE